MRRTIIGLVLVLSSVPFLVGAQTIEEMESQLRTLIAQLHLKVQEELAAQEQKRIAEHIAKVEAEKAAAAALESGGLSCPQISQSMRIGSRDGAGSEVSSLQNYLARLYGANVADAVTGYFGPLTETSVRKFQCEYLQLCDGTPESNGYGAVGPQTRAKIAEICVASGGDITDVSDMLDVNRPFVPLQGQACSFGSFSVAHGDVVLAYESQQARNGACQSEIRRCANGVLSGSFVHQFCAPSIDVGVCHLEGVRIPDGGTMTAYKEAYVPSGSTCVSQSRSCTGGVLSGTYPYAICKVGSAPQP